MLPTATEIREYLQGYGLDTIATDQRTGDVSNGSAVLSNIDTEGLLPGMRVSGNGIPNGAEIESVDHRAQEVTMDADATSDGTDETVTFTYFLYMTNDWIEKRRDRFIIPWIENKCRQSFTGQQQQTEYHSGNGNTILHLNTKPVVSVDNIELIGTGFEYNISPSSVVLIGDEGILKAKRDYGESSYYIALFPRGDKNIKVTYTAGWDTMPDDVAEAVTMLTAEVVLGQIANRTGGGDLNVQAYGRSYGARGKYTHERNDLARQALALLYKYFTGPVGG
jgi:hypothetical protein